MLFIMSTELWTDNIWSVIHTDVVSSVHILTFCLSVIRAHFTLQSSDLWPVWLNFCWILRSQCCMNLSWTTQFLVPQQNQTKSDLTSLKNVFIGAEPRGSVSMFCSSNFLFLYAVNKCRTSERNFSLPNISTQSRKETISDREEVCECGHLKQTPPPENLPPSSLFTV